jgi:hypothetical protein
MDKVLERMEWSKPFERGGNSHIKRGRGFAIANKAVNTATTPARPMMITNEGAQRCGMLRMLMPVMAKTWLSKRRSP